jgi:hypothetical protein
MEAMDFFYRAIFDAAGPAPAALLDEFYRLKSLSTGTFSSGNEETPGGRLGVPLAPAA